MKRPRLAARACATICPASNASGTATSNARACSRLAATSADGALAATASMPRAFNLATISSFSSMTNSGTPALDSASPIQWPMLP